MGNWAYLQASPIDRLPTDESERRRVLDHPGRAFEAKSLVPVFWLAMFQPDDWRVGRWFGDDHDEAYLMTPVATAVALLEARGHGLKALIGPTHAPLYDAFCALVRAELCGFVLLRLASVAGPASEGHVRAALETVARFAAGPTLGADALEPLRDLCGLHPGFRERDHVVDILSGGAPGWPVSAQPRSSAAVSAVVEPDTLARYLEQPWDVGRWQACLDELQATNHRRAWLMSWEQRGGWADFTIGDDAGLLNSLLGPLTRYVDQWRSRFHRGFLDVAALKAPPELRGKPFLPTLAFCGAALLAHPLWRTVRELRGEDDDVIACCQHPNFVSLSTVSVTAAGLSKLSLVPKPVPVRSATFSTFGLSPEPRSAWEPALEVGALTALRELSVNVFATNEDGAPLLEPAALAWLFESALGRQLEHLILVTSADFPRSYRLADWVPVVSGTRARRVRFTLALPATSLELTLQGSLNGEVTVHVETRVGFPGQDQQDVELASQRLTAALAGLPAGTRGTLWHDDGGAPGGVPLDPAAPPEVIANAMESARKSAPFREEERIWVELFAEVLAPQFSGGLTRRQTRAG